jgi:hypothetical protein
VTKIEDKSAALQWLMGREDEPGPREPQSRGRTALIRMLRADEPLDRNIRNALANRLEPIGSSQMELVLRLEKRGRGRPSNYVAQAKKRIADGAEIDAEVEKVAKLYIAVENFCRRRRQGKAAAYEAYEAYQRAKAAREGD